MQHNRTLLVKTHQLPSKIGRTPDFLFFCPSIENNLKKTFMEPDKNNNDASQTEKYLVLSSMTGFA